MRRPREDKIPNERRPAGQTKEWKSGERETEGAGRRDGREVGRKGRGYGRQHGLKRPVSDPVGGMAIRHSLRGGRRLYLDSARSVPAWATPGTASPAGAHCWHQRPPTPANARARVVDPALRTLAYLQPIIRILRCNCLFAPLRQSRPILHTNALPSIPHRCHVRRLHCLPTQQSVTVPPTARIHQSTIPSPAVASRTYLSSDPYPRARFPQGAGPDHTRRPGSGIPVLRPLHHPSVSSLHIDTQPWLRSGAHLSKNSEASPAGSSTLRSPAGPYPPTRWQGRLRTL